MLRNKLKYCIIQSNFQLFAVKIFRLFQRENTSVFILLYITFVNFLANISLKKPFKLRLEMHHLPLRHFRNIKRVFYVFKVFYIRRGLWIPPHASYGETWLCICSLYSPYLVYLKISSNYFLQKTEKMKTCLYHVKHHSVKI